MPSAVSTPVLGHQSVRRVAFSLAAALLLCICGQAAIAQTWNEIGDAGNLPGTSQLTVGGGTLTKILGSVPSATDVDMYCIRITDKANFNACLLCAVHSDQDIWLFDVTGKGVASAQTCQFGCKFLSNLYVPANGQYYLAVSAHGLLPLAGANAIWLPGTTLERAPDGPGAGSAITSWGGTGSAPSTPNYGVNLGPSSSGYCGIATPIKAHDWGSVKRIYR